MKDKNPKPSVFDPYGLEAMAEEFGLDAIKSRLQLLEERKRRWSERAADAERVLKRLRALGRSVEDVEAFAKMERALMVRLSKVNVAIATAKDLGPGFEIGHSFFCPGKDVVLNVDWFNQIVDFETSALLDEYWFNDPEKVKSVLKELRM